MVERTRIKVAELSAGDIVQQKFTVVSGGHTAEASRLVVVGAAVPDALPYNGHVHAVTRVTGLDVEKAKPVAWLAVPDQAITVTRGA